ncbi:hypothetical protein Fot_37469 [Forsythia ovata]|uniref:Uncharacterized protein n=1 Tax=Forsythia ovata TaxID=205694 RepID=A0ABD1RZ79_9LAMI
MKEECRKALVDPDKEMRLRSDVVEELERKDEELAAKESELQALAHHWSLNCVGHLCLEANSAALFLSHQSVRAVQPSWSLRTAFVKSSPDGSKDVLQVSLGALLWS